MLDQRIAQKRYIYDYYKKALGDLKGLSFIPMPDKTFSNFWLTAIQLDKDCKVKPLDIMLALDADDVESEMTAKPMHIQPIFAGYDYIDNGSVAETLFEQGVCLPSDTKMPDEDLERVCDVIRELWE